MAEKGILCGEYFLNGDIACAEGAISAGCRFFAGYPITPATEIAERMSGELSARRQAAEKIAGQVGRLTLRGRGSGCDADWRKIRTCPDLRLRL